jgi:hypothetical protein
LSGFCSQTSIPCKTSKHWSTLNERIKDVSQTFLVTTGKD